MKYTLPLIILGVVILAMVSTSFNSSAAQAQLQNASALVAATSDDSAKTPPKATDPEKPKAKSESEAGKDKGIGPIKELKLGPIDPALAEKGQDIFTKKCTVCHQLDSKKIGPALRDVANQQTPEFIMNMILNTDEMEKKDPYVKKLIAQYQQYMSVLDLTKDQARAVLEYLRSEAAKGKAQ